MAYFDEQPAIAHRSGGQINVYYGGAFTPDGHGHGHVKATGAPGREYRLLEGCLRARAVRLSSTTHGKP